ncbi:hypothetical protein [Streptomyces sp. S.PB5]|nr:hypothetical protein [Streptomyces sp. S.PB5]MDN3022327.1 hypothetical protein [Streptomyces sp. S.PB5]
MRKLLIPAAAAALAFGATAVPAGEVLTYIKDNLAEKADLG